MHVQALIIENNKILMVRQFITGKKVVWTLPGGSVEDGETYCEALRREMFEETGYEITINRVVLDTCDRVVYECTVECGDLFCDDKIKDNSDILEVSWLDLNEVETNEYVDVVLDRYFNNKFGRCN